MLTHSTDSDPEDSSDRPSPLVERERRVALPCAGFDPIGLSHAGVGSPPVAGPLCLPARSSSAWTDRRQYKRVVGYVMERPGTARAPGPGGWSAPRCGSPPGRPACTVAALLTVVFAALAPVAAVPQQLAVVSIATGATSVMEGSSVSFTLTRSGSPCRDVDRGRGDRRAGTPRRRVRAAAQPRGRVRGRLRDRHPHRHGARRPPGGAGLRLPGGRRQPATALHRRHRLGLGPHRRQADRVHRRGHADHGRGLPGLVHPDPRRRRPQRQPDRDRGDARARVTQRTARDAAPAPRGVRLRFRHRHLYRHGARRRHGGDGPRHPRGPDRRRRRRLCAGHGRRRLPGRGAHHRRPTR